MKNKFPNVAIIMMPHFNSDCLRVAVKDQRGPIRNVVIVTCSPSYNGVYEYDHNLVTTFEHWKNKKLDCYCVPISSCRYLGPLEILKDMPRTEDIIKDVKAQQKKFLKGEFPNNEERKNKQPEWLLK